MFYIEKYKPHIEIIILKSEMHSGIRINFYVGKILRSIFLFLNSFE